MSKDLNSDALCLPIQRMVFDQTLPGADINSFLPRNKPQKTERPDGVIYASDICYGEKYPNSYLDIYYADENHQQKPTVIYFHGGGCIFGDKISGDPLSVGVGRDIDFCSDISRHGYNVVCPNYALAPEYRFPVQIEQVDQVLKFLTENQSKYGLDMEHVFLGGGSAGANMTEIYTSALVNQAYAKKIGVIPSIKLSQISGLIIDESALSVRHFEEKMNAMLGCMMGTDDLLENTELSDLLDASKWVNKDYPPTYIICSNMEIWFLDSATDLETSLKYHGVEHVLYYKDQQFDHLEHGFMKNYQNNKYARECFDKMIIFMEEHRG